MNSLWVHFATFREVKNMSRDLRNIGNSRNDYPDKCYLYDSSSVKDNMLVKDSRPICRFYKKDLVSFQWQRLSYNGVVSSRNEFVGTIETMDHVEMAKPDMYVLDQTGALFIICDPVVSDDANKSKVVGMRPSIRTTMVLKGLM